MACEASELRFAARMALLKMKFRVLSLFKRISETDILSVKSSKEIKRIKL
jgi:hypothetical protein